MVGQEFDLFGDPVRLPNGKRGRPAHNPSQENRNKIIMLLAMGWSNPRIAGALHVSLPTLKRYYFSELKAREMQRDRFDAWRFQKLVKEVDGGNVGAMRLLDQMVHKNDMMGAADRMQRGDTPEKPAQTYVSKKATALENARETVNSENGGWGSDLKPGSLN